MSAPAGLLLLTGGQGRRLGLAKHAQPHPGGGSWGGYLVDVFDQVFPGCPVQVLGAALPDHPELAPMADPGQGPAVAVVHWAGRTGGALARRWWVVACDQVRWTPERLAAWTQACEAADPTAAHWVLALHAGHLQPLGGWLPQALRPVLARSTGASLLRLVQALPHLALPQDGPEWVDVDTPEERRDFEAGY
jgi:molybdopterin-guanine dinucleotide biosynthesis protein A